MVKAISLGTSTYWPMSPRLVARRLGRCLPLQRPLTAYGPTLTTCALQQVVSNPDTPDVLPTLS